MRVARERLQEAQEILLQHGFSKQHERIFSRDERDANRAVQCVVGFDDSDDPAAYELSVRCLERPAGGGRRGVDIEKIRVIDPKDAPPALAAAIEEVLRALQPLATG
ncbi:MAG: hypothetical protein IRZ10_05500 [Thermoflavifilum sp.]|nr:hypothetical protein [Thermoflavifilum sp.]MCL6513858.1 hypothetical protein [Alicyclobacillus sp.]